MISTSQSNDGHAVALSRRRGEREHASLSFRALLVPALRAPPLGSVISGLPLPSLSRAGPTRDVVRLHAHKARGRAALFRRIRIGRTRRIAVGKHQIENIGTINLPRVSPRLPILRPHNARRRAIPFAPLL